jgi:ketosteroid isomerase-like protein
MGCGNEAKTNGRNPEAPLTQLGDLRCFPPMKYESADSYRRSWEEWEPDARGEAVFNLENLTITAGNDVAFAHSFIRCGGTFSDGRTFQDLVRATFSLRKVDGSWMVEHQHVSKPYEHS